MPTLTVTPRPALSIVSVIAIAWAIAGCAGSPPAQNLFQREDFDSTATYSRTIPANATKTCEAARRALLSQGYVVLPATTSETVNARKSFQPGGDTHIEIEFRVVCTAETRSSGTTLAFVSALQDRYALKKSNNSASVGVGAFGSVSLPFSSSDDSLVKVASETISTASFYDRFFKLLTRYLSTEPDEPPLTPGMMLVPVPMSLPTPPSALGPQPSASSAAAAATPAASASAAPSPAAAASSVEPAPRPASAASGADAR